jgi:hypothetical protein
VIVVRALTHCFGCNPGEVFGLSPEQFAAEMKRPQPRVAVVEQAKAEAPAAPVAAVLDEPVKEENREGGPKRRRG